MTPVNEYGKQKSLVKQKPFLLLLSGMVLFFITACDAGMVYEKNKEIPGHVWKMREPLRFRVQVNDTISSHSIYINVRNYSDYPYSNLYLFIHVTSPVGDELTDTVNLTLADKRGKWLGKGLGDLYFIRAPYKRNIRFPYKGVYVFDIEQGMRRDLSGIRDVGLRVERMKSDQGGKK